MELTTDGSAFADGRGVPRHLRNGAEPLRANDADHRAYMSHGDMEPPPAYHHRGTGLCSSGPGSGDPRARRSAYGN